ncbi:class I SAM-dependent methyltransferase [Methylobacterium oryzihabitans]|uniref:Class I SAM-dependent methyltransferase n=1 Tax=Methylobacterium oryzihabitans TaxID=2499852 RepID=A0A3S2YS17_9HYPH|nr:class I SAM-dependent methyltransferase [Methylobacterium oryzihabitans]RVU17771.1 class I SAM-dependent methyltransferase [Methylobacterium oryzihabitans]
MKVERNAVDGLERYELEGEQYLRFFEKFFELRKPQSYFEIGVNKGKSLSIPRCASVGVDPGFIVDREIIGNKPELHLFQLTSDDFFKNKDLNYYFPSGVDVAFLDGMHVFEYLLRDFINIERFVNDSSTVFIHDCLPINAEMTERDRRPSLRKDAKYKSHWTGDVWKIIPALMKYRPELKLSILNCRPTGLVVVNGLDRSSKILSERYEDIVAEFAGIEMTSDSISEFYSNLELVDSDDFLGGLKT